MARWRMVGTLIISMLGMICGKNITTGIIKLTSNKVGGGNSAQVSDRAHMTVTILIFNPSLREMVANINIHL
jgi:hypothetical protein